MSIVIWTLFLKLVHISPFQRPSKTVTTACCFERVALSSLPLLRWSAEFEMARLSHFWARGEDLGDELPNVPRVESEWAWVLCCEKPQVLGILVSFSKNQSRLPDTSLFLPKRNPPSSLPASMRSNVLIMPSATISRYHSLFFLLVISHCIVFMSPTLFN